MGLPKKAIPFRKEIAFTLIDLLKSLSSPSLPALSVHYQIRLRSAFGVPSIKRQHVCTAIGLVARMYFLLPPAKVLWKSTGWFYGAHARQEIKSFSWVEEGGGTQYMKK